CRFFFQAEDGIRDFHVTGVQTCALPISAAVVRTTPQQYRSTHRPSTAPVCRRPNAQLTRLRPAAYPRTSHSRSAARLSLARIIRSEERRVGKGGGARWWTREQERRVRVD